jgi:nucleosome binding factor SPN SPT16 subunit
MLEGAIKPTNYKGPAVELILRNPKETNEAALEQLTQYVRSKGSQSRVGKIVGEPGIGNLIEEWKKITTVDNGVRIVDCPDIVDCVMAVKEPEEMENIKIAAKYSCFIMDNMIRKFENIIDENKKITHDNFATEIKSITEKAQFQTKFKEKSGISSLNTQLLEVGGNPVIQSGGHYNPQVYCANDANRLMSDIIICKVNARYKEYNANIIRTFMIDSDKQQQNYYKILSEAFNHLLMQMSEGTKLSAIYKSTVDFIVGKDSSLKANIPDNFGHGIGLEIPNLALAIRAENERKIVGGMTFNVVLGLIGLTTDTDFKYNLQIADTIVVKSGSAKENYTTDTSKSLQDIYYNMEDEQSEKKDNNKMNVDKTNEKKGRTRSAVTKDEEEKTENKRKEHQQEILQRKNEEFRERINRITGGDEVQISKKNLTSIKSYVSQNHYPSDMKPGKIYVDTKNDSVILPIFKSMVPFHVSLIKNVSKSDENSFSFLRINFHTPISGLTGFNELNLNQPVYIRDLSYKSKDTKNIANLFKMIKDLIKKVKAMEQEEREKSDLVAQESLQLMKGRRIVLNDVTIRPNITSKKTMGALELHTNGLRFNSSKGEKIDIIYKNVKHMFFQPCENELIVLIHLHLHNPILVGRKKTYDVQFYREAGSQADDLDMRRRGNDFEEYEIELRERQIREKINDEFSKFVEEAEAISKIEADVPYRELSFTGVPFKSNVTLIPTVNAIVSLIELPFFVLTLDEVELVYFERVSVSFIY